MRYFQRYKPTRREPRLEATEDVMLLEADIMNLLFQRGPLTTEQVVADQKSRWGPYEPIRALKRLKERGLVNRAKKNGSWSRA